LLGIVEVGQSVQRLLFSVRQNGKPFTFIGRHRVFLGFLKGEGVKT